MERETVVLQKLIENKRSSSLPRSLCRMPQLQKFEIRILLVLEYRQLGIDTSTYPSPFSALSQFLQYN